VETRLNKRLSEKKLKPIMTAVIITNNNRKDIPNNSLIRKQYIFNLNRVTHTGYCLDARLIVYRD